MNRLIILTAATLLLGACKDKFYIEDLDEPQKLVVNCFPSEADTTWIEVTHSVPISKGAAASHYEDMMEVNDAHVIYKVNGKECNVGWKDRLVDQWGTITRGARFFVVEPQHEGDRVELRVEADGYAPVEAGTVVSSGVPIRLNSIGEVRVYDSYYEESRNVYQLEATFADPGESTDYYAVRIRCKHFRGMAIGDLRPDCPDREQWADEAHVEWLMDSESMYEQVKENGWDKIYDFHLQIDSTYTNPEILTMSEPLLQPLGSLDSDFGFESEYYQQFYVFDDTAINGQTYTLHLNIATWHSNGIQYCYKPIEYQVLLFHLTPEFYRYVKSVNDIDNNELAQSGLSMLSPTYSNVRGGIGIVGGYCMTQSNWMTLPQPITNEIYYEGKRN